MRTVTLTVRSTGTSNDKIVLVLSYMEEACLIPIKVLEEITSLFFLQRTKEKICSYSNSVVEVPGFGDKIRFEEIKQLESVNDYLELEVTLYKESYYRFCKMIKLVE